MSKQQEKEKAVAAADTTVASTSLTPPVVPAMPAATAELQKLDYRFKFSFWHESEQVKVTISRKVQNLEEIVKVHGGAESFAAAYNAVVDEMIQPRLKKALETKYAGKAMLKTDDERKEFTVSLAKYCGEFVDAFTLDIPADYLIQQQKLKMMALAEQMLASIPDETAREMFRKQMAEQFGK